MLTVFVAVCYSRDSYYLMALFTSAVTFWESYMAHHLVIFMCYMHLLLLFVSIWFICKSIWML